VAASSACSAAQLRVLLARAAARRYTHHRDRPRGDAPPPRRDPGHAGTSVEAAPPSSPSSAKSPAASRLDEQVVPVSLWEINAGQLFPTSLGVPQALVAAACLVVLRALRAPTHPAASQPRVAGTVR
jgi:hypothetical protein